MHKNLALDGPVVNGLKKIRKLNSGELIPYANGLGVSAPDAKFPTSTTVEATMDF